MVCSDGVRQHGRSWILLTGFVMFTGAQKYTKAVQRIACRTFLKALDRSRSVTWRSPPSFFVPFDIWHHIKAECSNLEKLDILAFCTKTSVYSYCLSSRLSSLVQQYWRNIFPVVSSAYISDCLCCLQRTFKFFLLYLKRSAYLLCELCMDPCRKMFSPFHPSYLEFWAFLPSIILPGILLAPFARGWFSSSHLLSISSFASSIAFSL